MKNIITLILLALATFCAAQSNQVKTPGVSYSAGAPNWVPVVKTASELAIDTVAKRIYLWNRATATWEIQGQGIDVVSGGTAPAYTPNQTDSKFAINNASPPALYYYTGGAWVQINAGASYTAGTGIAISGSNVISTTAITALTGDVTASGPGSAAATIANGAVTNAKLGTGSVDSVKIAALSISDVHIKTVAPSKILQASATAGQVLAWNGTSSIWAPATPSGGGWGLTGNAATAGSSFLGTTNNVSLRFRTNNVQRMILDSLGNVGIGTTSPTERLKIVSGNIEIDAARRYRWSDGSFLEGGGTSNLFTIRSLGNFLMQGSNLYLATTAGTPTAKLHVVGAGATSANNALQIQNSTPSTLYNIRNDGQISYWATNTATGTTGAQTINRPSGTVNFAADATSIVVTNSLVTASSLVFPVVRTNDATATVKNIVCTAGSFTITLTAAATAETSVGFFVIN